MDYVIDRRFGEQIRYLRNQAGLSQEQLAAKLQLVGHDMSRSALAKIESGLRHVYLEDIHAFKQALNVSFDELLDISFEKES